MSDKQPWRVRFGWLEGLLVLAVGALFFQVFPGLWWGLLAMLDVRTWSRGMWFGMNLAVLAVLFAIRFGPELYADWRKRRARDRRTGQRQASRPPDGVDYQSRAQRDAEWRERAQRRRPWM